MSDNWDAVNEWALDWVDTYDQDWTPERLREWVGKRVMAHADTDQGPKGFTDKLVVGYGRDEIRACPPDEPETFVYRSTLILEEGVAVPVFSGMELEECGADT